jgi:hypothetical protein
MPRRKGNPFRSYTCGPIGRMRENTEYFPPQIVWYLAKKNAFKLSRRVYYPGKGIKALLIFRGFIRAAGNGFVLFLYHAVSDHKERGQYLHFSLDAAQAATLRLPLQGSHARTRLRGGDSEPPPSGTQRHTATRNPRKSFRLSGLVLPRRATAQSDAP